ncbi:MAG: FGGY-family carbohydrate kinase [Candidatus Thorarchaeota archaeon]|nr:FGGY-family carbohydrate kinase [Candidatus Thorarchaeota archaeon]
MTGYVLAHDVGTSGNKASIVDVNGKIIASTEAAYPVLYPKPGWAEQDPNEHWWQAICATTHRVLKESEVKPEDIIGLTFSTQMMGTIPVDKDGTPLMNCMIWLDTRAAKQNKDIVSNPIRMLRMLRITGGIPSGKDIIGKIVWLKEEAPQIYDATYKFLDCKDYLIYKCTGDYITSWDCANLTWFMDSRKDKNEWSQTILDWIDLDEERLPRLAPSTEIAGTLTSDAAAQLGLTTLTHVINGAGDMTAAGVGSGAVREKEVHVYGGSSGWVGAHVSDRKLDIFTYTGSIRSAMPDKYFVLAEMESAGACLKHLREHWHCDLCLNVRDIASDACADCYSGDRNPYATLDSIAERAPAGSEGLLFAPWMFGERSPIDDHNVRGGYFNLSLAHEKTHMTRAVLEGVALHTRWMMNGLEKRKMLGKVSKVNLIGGCANSDIWSQIYADVLQKPVCRMSNPLTAGTVGVAFVAYVALGEISDFERAADHVQADRVFEPDPVNLETYDQQFEFLKDYYRRNKGLWKKMNAH